MEASIGRFWLRWGRRRAQAEVFANADNPRDAKQAAEFGAEGTPVPHRAYVL
ncbi:MAG: hypothetical protein ACLR7U_12280 [Ruthenibacterium lactatiformans]